MNLVVALVLGAAHAAAFDHDHARLAEVLDGAVSSAGVDYPTVASRRATLDAYLEEVKVADTTGWTDAERLALHVNAYNAVTLRLILDEGTPKSIRDLDGGKVWDTRRFDVAGDSLTLNQMEHERARKLADGRVHAVVSCASKGCPPLQPSPLTPAGAEAQLDAAARQWASTNAFTLDGEVVRLSKIFDWYGEDFEAASQGDIAGVEGKAENALWFLSRYVDQGTRDKLLSGSLTVDWQDYDWSLNQR